MSINSTAADDYRLSQFFFRNSKYPKANAQYLSKKLREELEKLPTKKRNESGDQGPFRQSKNQFPKCIRRPQNYGQSKLKRKKKFPSYTKVRKQREELRQKLVSLIMIRENDDLEDNTFPNAEERRLLRYYYYIRHGIDTEHVAPLDENILKRILSLIPSKLSKWQNIIIENIEHLKTEYIFESKRAVIDFILGQSLEENYKIKESVTKDQLELKTIRKKYLTRFLDNRNLIKRHLYTINPCLRQILDLWQTKYTDLHFVSTKELSRSGSALDLNDFMILICKQIDDTKEILNTKWYETIKNILLAGVRRKHVPDAIKYKLIQRFFNCLNNLMTQCLQDIAMRSLKQFTCFIIDVGKTNPGIRLNVLLEDEDRLTFIPSFIKIQSEVLQIIDTIVNAIQGFECIEKRFGHLFHFPPNPSTIYLKPIITPDFIENCRYKIYEMLEEQRIGPELRLQDFDDYTSLINGSDADKIYKFMAEEQAFEDYCDLIDYYNDIEHEIPTNVWAVISLGFYEFHRTLLINTLEELARFMQTELIAKMIADQQADMASLQNGYEAISDKALTVPLHTAELMESKAYVANTQFKVIPEMEEHLKNNLNHFLWLMDHTIYSPLEIKQNSMTFRWYLKMPKVFDQNRKIIEEKTKEYQEYLKKRIEQFCRDLDLYWEQLADYENWGNILFIAKYKKKATILDARLTTAMEKIGRINEEEHSYGWPKSEYPLRKQTHDKLLPYKKLFDAGQDFIEKRDSWLNSQVGSFDPVDIANDISTIYEAVLKLEPIFENSPSTKKLSDDVKSIIDEFKLNMPIIQTLGNPGLKLRHWEQISEMVGFPIKVSAELTLQKIIDFGLEDYLGRFEKISESATKENGLEVAMDDMITEWHGIEFIITEYRDTGTYILSSVNDIQTLLDDHIIKTQAMKNSPYIKPFKTEILEWESKLVLLQDIVDDWLRVQSTWIYLEPIFSSPDIQQQMPEESRRFSAVDKIWKDLMKQVQSDASVMSVVEIDKMSEKLKKAFNLLEIIQKGLNTYLEKKRFYFPRFFFLSNDGLLEILAETKDPKRVQPHLRKCFSGIHSLVFNETFDVLSIKSIEGEELKLSDSISTSSARGQVEKWLRELEDVMKRSVRDKIKQAFEKYSEELLNNWLLQWPDQCVQIISKINWTAEVEASLLGKNLHEISLKYNEHIINFATMMRRNLVLRERLTLRTLIIFYTHAKDVVDKLIEVNAMSVSDFNWLSQMRFYIHENYIDINMITSKLPYGYEYIGNLDHLVVTPLTDRCYRIIFGALNSQLGVVVQGGSGIGKTEMIKDLAKDIGKECVVFNCSNGLDYVALGKFFKGLAACGTWFCFDEFDRISIDTLSVGAQQILTIQRALNLKQNSFCFNGTTLQLDTSCAIFITTTINFTVDTNIPENLKSLFRPAAISAPDLQLIIEIELYSRGFSDAKGLAIKIITVFELCNKQLSLQPHYDFNNPLRMIKIILNQIFVSESSSLNENDEETIFVLIRKNTFSKLVSSDVNAFEKILADVFPEVHQPDTEDSAFKEAVSEVCRKNNIDCTDYLAQRVQQIYEIMSFRSGVMIIGDPFSGKTTAYRILAEALDYLNKNLNKDNEQRTSFSVINPKSLTLGEFYGEFEKVTHEWRDGILANNFRSYCNSSTLNRKWLIFDGPIDSIWMENINSVLDDNRKLCLMSGDILYLTPTMNLFFEALDLKNASPSIVSRCGVVYMQSCLLGWHPLLNSWKNTLPPIIQESNKEEITSLFMRFCPILLHFVHHGEATKMLNASDSNLIRSLMNLFDCFLDEYHNEKYTENLSELDVRAQLEGIFFFACIWSIGACLNEQSRTNFSELFHGLSCKEFPKELYEKFNIPERLWVPDLQKPFIFTIPKKDTVFDYRFIKEGKGKWKLWSDEVSSAPPLPRDIPANQIIITTVETIRIYSLLDLLTRHGKLVLLVGPTATGKTFYATDYYAKRIDTSTFTSLCMNFSAHITANQTQDIIMSRLDKRRKGVFGPSLGKKFVLFVDDLSMPLKKDVNAQPPVELLRMMLDHSMWYEKKDYLPIKLIDIQISCAMASPYLTGNSVTCRFLRHFNVVAIDNFTNDTLKSIFSKILLWHLDARGFSKEFDPCIDEIVDGTLFIHRGARKILLPTPAKCHYIFNVRDFSRVIQGVLLSVPEATEGIDAMRRLWVHEILRVYGDRLIDENDTQWLFENICLVTKQELHTDTAELFSRFIESSKEFDRDGFRKLIYCDFTNPKADTRNYLEVQDIDELRFVVESYLVEFNNVSKRPMNLVLFKYAIEHLSHVCRILKQPRSHALIIGVGGTGRQSYTRLAAHITDNELFQIEMTAQFGIKEWRDFLKAMLLRISSTESHGILLFTDNQIKDENFLEDINNLLKSGEILDLFNADENKEIIEKMQQIDKQRDKSLQTDGSHTALYNFFVNVIREQLHIVLCFSPIGTKLRNYIRKYPSIIDSCSVSWLQSWPEDALKEISTRFLAGENITDSNRACITEMLLEFKNSTDQLSSEYYLKYKKHVYVPSALFLESIYIFKDQLGKKLINIQRQKKRYQSCLIRLDELATQVTTSQKLLEALEPQLKEVSEKIAQQATEVQTAIELVEEQRERVKQDEVVSSEHSVVAADLAETCSNIMSVALPMMQDAENALHSLLPADISSIRTMKNPSINVKIVMEAICILREYKTDKMSATTDEFWAASKKLLADPKFLDTLINYEKEAIPPHIFKRLEERVLVNEAFDGDKIKSISIACECLYKWIIALIEYDKAIKLVTPKRAALKEAEEKRDVSVSILNAKIEELRLLEENLADLQRQLSLEKRKFEDLKADNEDASKKLQRATEIVNCLVNEKEYWTNEMEELDVTMKTVLGDVLLGAGIVTYLGEFNCDFRRKQISDWLSKCKKLDLDCDENFNLSTVFSDPIQLKTWIIFGLPVDAFLTDSAVILTQSKRWPLIVDPQRYASKWIKMMEKGNRLCTLKLTQPDYLRVLENALQYGLPVLLENIGTEMDPILESVLQREVFKQSGSMSIKLGDSMVEYNDAFRLYITTNLNEPNYSAEIAAKVAIVNFIITQTGLENNLLAITVMRERPDLEAEKNQLNVQSADVKKSLRDEKEKILSTLASDGNILDDDNAVQVVTTSKLLVNELHEKQNNIKSTEKQIDGSRFVYHPIASHASILYFSIIDFMRINSMYQYSLLWFTGLFTSAIDSTDKVDDVQQRIKDLIKYLSINIYAKVCRGLFQKDKLLFSIQLAKNICSSMNNLDNREWLFLLEKSDSSFSTDQHESPINWITTNSWNQIKRLSALPHFTTLPDHIIANQAVWMEFFNESNDELILPQPWCNELTYIQKLLVFKCFHTSKFVTVMQLFVQETLGKEFVEGSPLDLSTSFADSTSCIPILFILQEDIDPMSRIINFFDKQSIENKCLNIQCFSQDYGRVALKQVEECIRSGNWIILQNCHLAPKWLDVLEKIIDNLAPDTTHPDFRLWLTSKPMTHFPMSILQNCVKLVDEEPKDLRKNMKHLYLNDPICNEKWFNAQSELFKRSLYSLCSFHAVVRGRQEYGPIGWNSSYRFTDLDLRIGINYLTETLDNCADTPLDRFQYIISECVYGGHIIDRFDKTCLTVILKHLFLPLLPSNENRGYFENLNLLHYPDSNSIIDYLSHIESLNFDSMSTVYGLHKNAEYARGQLVTHQLVESIAIIQDYKDRDADLAVSFSESNNEAIIRTADEILGCLSHSFDIRTAEPQSDNEEFINLILAQELTHYNSLLHYIRESTLMVRNAVKGKINLSIEIEDEAKSMMLGRVPDTWLKRSHPSLKPLGSYIKDFIQRLQFFQKWHDNGPPKIFWLPAFYFTEAFLTGILQNYARKSAVSYNLITIDFHVQETDADEKKLREFEYCINGLFIEGARWCNQKRCLIESKENVFYDEMPAIKLIPVKKVDEMEKHAYNCPIYKTLERSRKCSENVVASIKLDCDLSTNVDHWILRGCALICQLDT